MPKKAVKLPDKELCNKWIDNKNVNPETLRKIKETGAVYKKLAKKCFDNHQKKLNASKKIYKFFIPYIKRSTVNIIDRINYFIIMKKYLMSIKEKNNCFRLYNIDEKIKEIKYRIGKKIILDKNIGTASINGIVYLSHFKSNIKYGTKFDKLNKFAVKITNQSNKNRKELEVLSELTKEVIDFKCPHFPICYGYLECNNTDLKSNNSDDYSIVKDKHTNTKLLPKLINKNKKLLIQINELASGDLNSNINSDKNNDLLNTITQLFISIMFFHNTTKSHHCDIHDGNFLFHKINPGGYFHYNIYGIDYYLENKGLLWVIWDFSYIKPFTKNININIDYSNLCNIFNNYNNIDKNDYLIIKKIYNTVISKYNNITDINKINNIDKLILDFLLINVKSFTTIKPSKIINKKPYVI